MSRGFASNYRIGLVGAFLCLCFGGIAARLVWLHVVDRDELLGLIVQTRRQRILEHARRGDILDRHGAILATSRPLLVLAVDPLEVRTEDAPKWPKLAVLLGIPPEEVRTKFTTKFRADGGSAGKPGAARPAGPAPPRAWVSLDLPGALAAPQPAEPARDESDGPSDSLETETDSLPDAEGRHPIRWARLSNHVTDATYAEIEKLGIRGLCPPERWYRRVYPQGQLAAHIVGYTNFEGKGVAGIERYADFYLRGQDGWREGERDGRNRELPQFQLLDIPRADGFTVKLSIDSTVQDIVEQELAAIAQQFDPVKAIIIVSEPQTGFILGMANYPTFDPNHCDRVPRDQMIRMKNAAVADIYEPGSVFKIVAVSAALDLGLVTPNTVFNCSLDRVDYGGRNLKLPGEAERFPHQDAMTVAEIIDRSSNRGAAQLGMLLGKQRLNRYARAFGFGHRLGFPVGGEVPGMLADPKDWNAIDITRIPMGQSIAATALQMHQAMSVIADGGVLLRPQVIREIRDTSGAVVYRYARSEIGRVISERTAATIDRLLEGVARTGGTAPEAGIVVDGQDYEVAGKTGTAQKLVPETDARGRTVLRYSHTHHVGSFVGYFPASRPQVAISIVVDDADARLPGGWGAKVAAPSFRRIGEKLIPILSITPPNRPSRADFLAAAEGGCR